MTHQAQVDAAKLIDNLVALAWKVGGIHDTPENRAFHEERFREHLRAALDKQDARRVPLTQPQIDDLYRRVMVEVSKLELEERYTFAGWFPVAVREIEAAHGIAKVTGATS